MMTGEEHLDQGQVAVDRGVTIGYFSQDVGEMAGRSAVAEVMDGAGSISAAATELKELEHAMADPRNVVVDAVSCEAVSASNSLMHGKLQGILPIPSPT